ncbi:MAG: hypothetical protein HYY17_03600 [Planctomycetes bacterium]|nr:hypothetical protein [Planctomycetota bacterium]
MGTARIRQRGVVLIVVLGILVILAMTGTVFCLVQSIERHVSRNYVDHVRAKLLAQSGVEHARDELRRNAERGLLPASGPRPWKYWGNDLTETSTATANVPVEDSRNPSFALEQDGNPFAGSPAPKALTVQGQPRGLSGMMESGTYAVHGDQYVLKVTDASGKIHLNEGLNQYGGSASTGSRNLRRILNRLGQALAPPIAGLGDTILANRPPGGYRSVMQLRKFLSPTQYLQVIDCVTAHAWVDATVANPVPYTAAHAQAIETEFGVAYWRGSPPVYRFGRGKDYLGNPVGGTLQVYPATTAAGFPPNGLAHGVYAMDELNPVWIEVTSRAPVNVNEARREVLIALLADLRGVFLSERRRNNIETSIAGAYHYEVIKHTYSPANMPLPPGRPYSCYNVPEGDELGFLYETYPIVGPGSTTSGIPASVVAEEIIACREQKSCSPVHAQYGTAVSHDAVDYATLPFRGTFRTWRQFDAFCDHLVTAGILVDPRPIFFDHPPGPIMAGNITGNTPLAASDFERLVASRAIADVLKANFNPNVHLNELNPDRNLYRHVDKTDLLVTSTEFIFTPTGHYDVESVGRVLRPVSGDDALTASDNEIVAEAKVHAGLKIFDLIRETSQSHFAPGTCSARTSGVPTNNNRSLEVGPEPDNGPAPLENAWAGYIAFPTVGGNHQTVGATKPTGTWAATPQGASEMGETIHAHLSWDFDAHHHADGNPYRKDLGSNALQGESVQNYPDPGEAAGGPYDTVDQNNRYRLARSFSLPSGPGSASLPVLDVRAPMDLRLDGGYLDRHGGLAYWISPQSYAASTAVKQGVISYWIKPNFDPARSGKPRLYADMSRRTSACSSPVWYGVFTQASFTHLWNPGHNAPVGNAPQAENQSTWMEVLTAPYGAVNGLGILPFKPQSMLFGCGWGWATGFCKNGNGVYYHFMETRSLNHEGHGHNQPSLFKGHEWVHVLLSWKRTAYQQPNYSYNVPSFSPAEWKVIVNGEVLPGSLEVMARINPQFENDAAIDWTLHKNGDRNSIRIGAPSQVWSTDTSYDNFSADSTVDEIYFYNTQSSEDAALQHWLMGRYSRPKADGEGVFTSRPIPVSGTGDRVLAPAGTATPPWSTSTTSGTTVTAVPEKARILGISWTWYGEGMEVKPDGTWAPTLTDHGASAATLYPVVEASIVGLANDPLSDDGYSPVKDPAGSPPEVAVNSTIQYRLAFKLPGAELGTILLATPVVDDVTLYVSFDQVDYTYYFQDRLER